MLAVIFSSLVRCLFCWVAIFKGQLLSSYSLFLLAFWSFLGKPSSEVPPPQLIPESSFNSLRDISLKKVDFWLHIRSGWKKTEPCSTVRISEQSEQMLSVLLRQACGCGCFRCSMGSCRKVGYCQRKASATLQSANAWKGAFWGRCSLEGRKGSAVSVGISGNASQQNALVKHLSDALVWLLNLHTTKLSRGSKSSAWILLVTCVWNCVEYAFKVRDQSICCVYPQGLNYVLIKEGTGMLVARMLFCERFNCWQIAFACPLQFY